MNGRPMLLPRQTRPVVEVLWTLTRKRAGDLQPVSRKSPQFLDLG